MYTTILQPDSSRWDEFVAGHPRSHFLQVSGWGVLKSAFGWSAQRIAVADGDGNFVAGTQILYRKLPLRAGKLAYVPFGPLVDWDKPEQVKVMFNALDRTARKQGAIFLKLEPGYGVDPTILAAYGYWISPQTVQPPRTIVLEISGRDAEKNAIDEDIILKRMNQGTRRNIRKSDKNDVSIRIGNREDMRQFNVLLQTTSDRQDFGVHVSQYYEKIYDLFVDGQSPVKTAFLIASYNDENGIRKDLAGVMIFVLGKQAWYISGASSNEERQRMASFGVQWAAIQWAREQGAEVYDMVGVPDEDENVLESEFQNRDDGLWGVYRFKRGWGGRVMRTIGAWDRVYNPMLYWAYRAYVKLRETQTE
jgi:lipid II:glycine glycyltransferase (peptidoglycan interpeptide bridge formation enzyme)